MEQNWTHKTIAAYDKNGEKYVEKFAAFAPYKKQIEDFCKAYIPAGSRVLDLGCGPGNNISRIKALRSSCMFTGVDLSQTFLQIAGKAHPEATFIHGNICELQPTSSYDTIIASFCIVHLSDLETLELISFIGNSLMAGGSLYISFMEGAGAGFETTSFSREEIYFNYYRREEIEKHLLQCNIEIEEVRTVDYPEEDGSTTTDVFIFGVKRIK